MSGPGGVAKIVVPGRKPWIKVSPAFLLVANPILEAPPSKNRPDWKGCNDGVAKSKGVRLDLRLVVTGGVFVRVAANLGQLLSRTMRGDPCCDAHHPVCSNGDAVYSPACSASLMACSCVITCPGAHPA